MGEWPKGDGVHVLGERGEEQRLQEKLESKLPGFLKPNFVKVKLNGLFCESPLRELSRVRRNLR